MDFWTIFQTVIDNIAVPVFIAIGGGLAIIASKWTDKIGNSITIKNEIDNIEKRMKTRKDILDSLAPTVEAAVASNMDMVMSIKKKNGKLSNNDIIALNKSAMELVMSTLPPSLTEDDGVLLEIIGGRAQLESSIKAMIEKYVFEYKLKLNNTNNISSTNKINNNNSYSEYINKMIR